MAAAEGWADADTRKALQVVERRQRNRAAAAQSPYGSLEGALAAAEHGLDRQLLHEIAHLAGVKPTNSAADIHRRRRRSDRRTVQSCRLKASTFPRLVARVAAPVRRSGQHGQSSRSCRLMCLTRWRRRRRKRSCGIGIGRSRRTPLNCSAFPLRTTRSISRSRGAMPLYCSAATAEMPPLSQLANPSPNG